MTPDERKKVIDLVVDYEEAFGVQASLEALNSLTEFIEQLERNAYAKGYEQGDNDRYNGELYNPWQDGDQR